MKIVKLPSKNQITISKEDLAYLGVKPSKKLVFSRIEDGLLLKPLTDSVVQQTAGSLTRYVAPKKLGISFSQILQETKRKTAKNLS